MVNDIKSILKNGESNSFAIAIKWIWRFFYLTFYQISGIENLLWPMEYNAFNIHSRVRVMKPSW